MSVAAAMYTPICHNSYQLTLGTMSYVLSIPLPAGNPMVTPVKNCCLPSINDISANVITQDDEDMCAMISWTEAPGDCDIHPWMLAVLEWDRIPEHDFADEDHQSCRFGPLSVRAECPLIKYVKMVNRSWDIVCNLTTTKYYQFQLSTKVQPCNTSLKFGSHTYFFGKSSEFIASVHSCVLYMCIITVFGALRV